jgi:hypothetical protein
MTKLQGPKTPDKNSLLFEACSRCGVQVTMCRASRNGDMVPVERAPAGRGDVGIVVDIFTKGPTVSELGGSIRSTYRLHAPRCKSPVSHSLPPGTGRKRRPEAPGRIVYGEAMGRSYAAQVPAARVIEAGSAPAIRRFMDRGRAAQTAVDQLVGKAVRS